MEFVVEQLKMWWQFVLVGVLILLGYIYDRRYTRTVLTGFSCEKMPCMIPIRIPTKGKGFFGAIWLWLMSVRTWEIGEDFHYKLYGQDMVIPKGFVFDGASVPKFLATWLSPVGVLLLGGLVHDYGYKYQTLLLKNKKETIGIKNQQWMDKTFRDINIEINGFKWLNYLAWYALRAGGFMAWNGHRKVNATIEGIK